MQKSPLTKRLIAQKVQTPKKFPAINVDKIREQTTIQVILRPFAIHHLKKTTYTLTRMMIDGTALKLMIGLVRDSRSFKSVEKKEKIILSLGFSKHVKNSPGGCSHDLP